MKTRTTIVLAVLALAVAIVLGSATLGLGVPPVSQTDELKVPHYFGPYSNYANSPLTEASATVGIGGSHTGVAATAMATVGANGAITGITITNPGSGYTAATVAISGAGTLASADASVTASGSVTSVAVTFGGGGYTKPKVTIDPPVSVGTTATATAYGEVDSLKLGETLPGDLATYHRPTVAFDLPDDPNGTQPTAHVLCTGDVEGTTPYCNVPANPDGTPGLVTITSIKLDTFGSGYSSAPGVAILDGTQFDPVRPGGSGATVTATLKVTAVTVDTFGSGYTAPPTVVINDNVIPPTPPTATLATAVASTSIGAVTGITSLIGGSGYLTPGGIKKF